MSSCAALYSRALLSACIDVPTKKRAHEDKRQSPAKKRVAPARPRMIDLRDYYASRPTDQVHADLQPCRGGNSTLMSESH
jgi:hypothetical protein